MKILVLGTGRRNRQRHRALALSTVAGVPHLCGGVPAARVGSPRRPPGDYTVKAPLVSRVTVAPSPDRIVRIGRPGTARRSILGLRHGNGGAVVDQRIKLVGFELTAIGGGRVSARVVLAWSEGEEFEGNASGDDSPHGQLRAAAEATAQALVGACNDRIGLEVLAVKAIEAFDTILVVVSLSSRVDNLSERLVGATLIRGREPARGSVLAVLDATNRLIGRVMQVEV